MNFIKKLVAKRPGGSPLGNIGRFVGKAGSAFIGVPGLLGSGAALEKRNSIADHISNVATAAISMIPGIGAENTTFAGQPAAKLPDGTYQMKNELPPVSVSAFRNSDDTLFGKIGQALEPAITNATKGMQVGADDSTKNWLIAAALIIGGAIVYSTSKR